ncbi:MAG TPA: succinate dehydrogenase cytochrome b subunit [bacterium]|nr:succinate dehydrogenase cytochrome b subunit [bacterium]
MWNSTVSLKIIVALTGVILLLFVIGHMIGNLQVFLGPEVFNAYGEKLRAFPALLWLVRAVIALTAIVHIVVTIRLTLLNNAARPIDYAQKRAVRATLASRTMVYSGLMVLAFVVYHLAHYTWKITNPQYQRMLDAGGRPDIHAMVIAGFSNPLISVSYVVAMILLGFHLSHGIASVFQTAGWASTRTLPKIEKAATVITVILVLGYISIPISILLGVVR